MRLAEVKKEMRAEVLSHDESIATRLVFTDNELKELQWEEESSEFVYRGEMYDVIKIQKDGGKTIVWCIDDRKETALITTYLKFHKQSPEKNPSNSLLKFLTIQFEPTAFCELTPLVSNHSFNYSLYTFTLPFSEGSILLPPPKSC